jgi:release factor glutamine methyltransferase
MTIQKIKQKYSQQINSTDLELLLEFILRKTKEELLTNTKYKLSSWENIQIKYYTKQLKNHKPIDYIIGRKEFYGLDFKVNKHTLVPRPETEQIVDLASEIITNNQQRNFTIIDLGTGSGNIVISLLKKLQTIPPHELQIGLQAYASDISSQALKVAKLNALYHRLGIKFVQGSLLTPFNKLLTAKTTKPVISGCCGNISATCNKLSNQDVQSKILLITANLPYLSTKIYNDTAQNVKNYEPKTALVSGDDGLNHYRELLQQVKNLKTTKDFSFQKTYLLLEISPEQKGLIQKEILKVFPLAEIKIYKDLAQKWRIVIVKID